VRPTLTRAVSSLWEGVREMKVVPLVLVAMLLIGSGVAFAQDYLPGRVPGQIAPERALAHRLAVNLVPDEAYAPYTSTARYAFGAVTAQIAPERALVSRTEAGAVYLVSYLPFTAMVHYAPGCVCGQISPDRALAERTACGICTR